MHECLGYIFEVSEGRERMSFAMTPYFCNPPSFPPPPLPLQARLCHMRHRFTSLQIRLSKVFSSLVGKKKVWQMSPNRAYLAVFLPICNIFRSGVIMPMSRGDNRIRKVKDNVKKKRGKFIPLHQIRNPD